MKVNNIFLCLVLNFIILDTCLMSDEMQSDSEYCKNSFPTSAVNRNDINATRCRLDSSECSCLDCAECYHANANAPDQSDFKGDPKREVPYGTSTFTFGLGWIAICQNALTD